MGSAEALRVAFTVQKRAPFIVLATLSADELYRLVLASAVAPSVCWRAAQRSLIDGIVMLEAPRPAPMTPLADGVVSL